MSISMKTRGLVLSVISYGQSLYGVCFETEKKVPHIKPGQFLHLSIDDYDPAGGFWPESRVFSIASTDGERSISIVYSVKGRYTKAMEKYLAPGKQVWIKLPYGDFVIDPASKKGKRLVLVAGGTGIAPFVPFLQECLKEKRTGLDVHLYYGVRTAGLVLFPELLLRCSDELAGFRYDLFIEDGSVFKQGNMRFSRRGILDIDVIHKETADTRNFEYYLSGPPGMIQAFSRKLSELGVPEDFIRMDNWE